MASSIWQLKTKLQTDEIFDYIAANSFRYATITTDKIYQRVQIIADNPFTGKIVDEFNEKSIRELIEGKYRIIYRIKTNNQVDILRIYHSARLLKRNKID